MEQIAALTSTLVHSLRSTPRPGVTPAPSSLRREDVERIVRRTEQHFTARLEDQQNTIRDLTARLAAMDAERANRDAEIESLKRQLQKEKHHRLECEEQSHQMIEEHAKQVQHLESRLRKLEPLPSARGTPRSSRAPRFEDDSVLGHTLPDAREAVTPASVPGKAGNAAGPASQFSTSAVNDFLTSIGRELDAINAMETHRGLSLV